MRNTSPGCRNLHALDASGSLNITVFVAVWFGNATWKDHMRVLKQDKDPVFDKEFNLEFAHVSAVGGGCGGFWD